MKVLPLESTDDLRQLSEELNRKIIRRLQNLNAFDIDPASILPASWGFSVPSDGILYGDTGEPRRAIFEFPGPGKRKVRYQVLQTWANGLLRRMEFLDPSSKSLGALNYLWVFHTYRWDLREVKYEAP